MHICGRVCRFFQVEGDASMASARHRRAYGESPPPGSGDYLSEEGEEDEELQHRPARRQPRKRAKRVRRSPSLSAFEDEDEGLDDDSEGEAFMREAGSEPPSDFPTPLKNAYARCCRTSFQCLLCDRCGCILHAA